MIWQSISVMTITDIVIVSAIAYALWFLIDRMRAAADRQLRWSVAAIVLGLGVAGSFYLSDLVVMHLLALAAGSETQLATQSFLRSNGWIFALFAIVPIIFGLVKGGRIVRANFEASRISERRLADYSHVVGDWFWEIDRSYAVTYVSESYTQLTGKPRDAILGTALWEFSTFEQDPAQVRAILDEGEPFRDRISIVQSSDGTQLWISNAGVPIYDPDGEFQGYRGISTDVTASRLAARALQESELQLRQLVEGSLQGISISDGQRRLFVNQAYADMLGYSSPQEVVATVPYLEPLSQNDRKTVSERVLNRLRFGGQGEPFETEMVRKDGSTITVLVMDKAIDWQGKPALLATLIDITERIEADRARRASEENFRRIVELSDQGFCIHDALKPVFVNSAVARIFGYDSAEELLGLDSLLSIIPEKEHQRVLRYNDRRKGERADTYELEGKRKDGSALWLQITAQTVLWEGRTLVGVTVVDISDRKQREQALLESHKLLQSLIDGMPDFVALKNAAGQYLFVNRVFEQWYGVPRSQAIGTTLRDYHPAHIADRVTAEELDAVNGRIPRSTEIEATWPDGNDRITVETRFPVFDEDGNIVARGTISRDVTDVRRTEANLRQAQKMDGIGQLTGGVAHDFNNMLAVIIGNLDLASTTLEPDHAATSYLQSAMMASERGAMLTQRLLAFARKQPLQVTSVDLHELVTSLRELLRRTLGETIDIEVKRCAGLWPCEVDAGQLEQVLLNLALNARDAMPRGGKLTIETENARLDGIYARANSVAPGQYAVLSVSDTGCGLYPGTQEHIFEPFFTTKEVGQGTGLGLSMVWGFVKQSGGHVAVDSEIDKGTTFRIYLPRSFSKGDTQASRPLEDPAPAHQGEVVLLVEDDDSLRDVIKSMLLENGYQVLAAADADSALVEMDNATRVDLMLTDVVLPSGVSGPDLATHVLAKEPETKVVYMSGYTDDEVTINGRLDEGVELLQKPFAMDLLASRLRQVLDRAEPASEKT